MRTGIAAAAVAALLTFNAQAQEASDAMDMSAAETQTTGGLVTVSEVGSLRETVNRLLADDDCEEAIGVLPVLAHRANNLSNLIRRGLEPLYSARSREQGNVLITDAMVSRERLSDEMIEVRNRAWVDEAQCHIEAGNNELAAARLYHALDLISVSENETWEAARNALWRLVEAEE